MKRVFLFLLVFGILVSLSACSSQGFVTVCDAKGAVIAELKRADFPDSQLKDPSYRSFVQYAMNEAVTQLSQIWDCALDEATNRIFRENLTVKTSFDLTAHKSIAAAYENYEETGLALAGAVLDNENFVLAVFSGGEEEYALMGHSPFSTIKPLSVYSQAMEKGLIDWSSTIKDAPYKQITNEEGFISDWPTNPGGGYSYSNIGIIECIKFSLNTTAVHCLKDVGVSSSVEFLQKNFGMNLEFEKNKITIEGEDEVIGNIAMGYLNKGVTPMELAGYYRVFANQGEYSSPRAVMSISDVSGKEIFSTAVESKRVLTKETAYLMNRLLTNVVSSGGTGENAKVEGTELIGKTGTGDDTDGGGNWFVGVTPEYSCAVWHGDKSVGKNIAADIFTEIMAKMPAPTVAKFDNCPTVSKGIFCVGSGKLSNQNCMQIEIGYYASARRPKTCGAH